MGPYVVALVTGSMCIKKIMKHFKSNQCFQVSVIEWTVFFRVKHKF